MKRNNLERIIFLGRKYPSTGVTPLGWWLHRLWIEKIPRFKSWPGHIELSWLGLRDTGLLNDWYVRKMIYKWPRR